MFGIRRSLMVAVMAIVAMLASTAAAYAYWTTTGSGTGTATVAKIKPLVITQVAVKGMVPGGDGQDLKVTVTNPNDYAVNIAQQVLTVTPAVDKPLCEFSENFALTPPAEHPAVVPVNGAVSFSGGTITLLDRPDVDQAICQGAVITFRYTLTPH